MTDISKVYAIWDEGTTTSTFSVTVPTPTVGGIYIVGNCIFNDIETNTPYATWNGANVTGKANYIGTFDDNPCGLGKAAGIFVFEVPSSDYGTSKTLNMVLAGSPFSLGAYAIFKDVGGVRAGHPYTNPTSAQTMPHSESPSLANGEWNVGGIMHPVECNGVINATPNVLVSKRHDGQNKSLQLGYSEKGETLVMDVVDASEYYIYQSFILEPVPQSKAKLFMGKNF